MAYYLQMNGTSDRIQIPSLTFDKVIFDVVSRKATGKTGYLIDARTGTTGYLYSDTSLNEQFAAFRLYVNDVQYSSGTNAIPAGTRATVRLENPIVGSDDVTLFARYTGIQFLQADVYDVKFYNGATLVAHYDMTTQTVNDQSGNGNHATLTGGTWVDDGTGGGDPGTDVSYAYATKQSIYTDRNVEAQTKQVVYADRQYVNPTKQAFYSDRSWSYAMLQQILGDYVSVSASFPTLQKLYADRVLSTSTKQTIYDDKSYVYLTKQRIYEIIYTELQTIWTVEESSNTVWGSLSSSTTEWTTTKSVKEERKYAPE